MFRIFGIAVRIHWSMLLVFAFYFFQAADRSGWWGVGMMAVSQAIFLVSILFHELGHCWMAIRHRGHAEKILIWPLGGYSVVDYERGPRQQLLVAGIGPISSLLLSGIFFGILRVTGVAVTWAHVLPYQSWYPMGFSLAQVFLLHAARLNLLLAAFNLVVPAYPLDGGQLLFALLTMKFGRLRAAQIVAPVSMVVGALIAFAGLAMYDTILILIGIQVVYEGNQLRYLIRIGELDVHPGFGAASGPEFDYMPDRPKKKGFLARWKEKRARASATRDRDRELAESARVDAVLEKVSREGIGSLTADERRILDQASRRSRDRE